MSSWSWWRSGQCRIQAQAQLGQTESWVAHIANEYRVVPNVTYLIANNRENKVDLYLPENASGPTPVLMYIHGGGWRQGSKESYVLRVLPYLEMGWAVVNVQYRLAHVSQAPAAVEDCLCALRWIIRNAEGVQLRPVPHRPERPVGRGTSDAHDRHDPGISWTRRSVSGD